MKKRILFNKFDEMKYISHLDTMRFIERLFKISKIPLIYTQGFNPRPKLSFGYPASLGIETYAEPMDFGIEIELSNKEILKRLNEYSPRGFEVTKVMDRGQGHTLVKDYNVMVYEIEILDQELLIKFKELLLNKEIIHIKNKKGKIKKRDMKSKIKKVSYEENKILIYLEEVSPKRFFEILETEQNYKIKRIGYDKIEEV